MNHSIYGILQKYRHKHKNVGVHEDLYIKNPTKTKPQNHHHQKNSTNKKKKTQPNTKWKNNCN